METSRYRTNEYEHNDEQTEYPDGEHSLRSGDQCLLLRGMLFKEVVIVVPKVIFKHRPASAALKNFRARPEGESLVKLIRLLVVKPLCRLAAITIP